MTEIEKNGSAHVELSTFQKIAAVVMGAFLMGALWRFRGEHGYGASWGLLTVGTVFLLLVFAIFGFRRKVNFFLYSFTAVSFMLTTPGWGTLNSQITGVLGSGVYTENGRQLEVFINPLSGLFIMLCMGFGLAAVFAFLLGRFFSDRLYGLKEFLIVITVFLAVEAVAKLSVAHVILDLVHPQTGALFITGLSMAGVEGTPWQVYLQHFFNYDWAKELHGGRNYFASVDAAASAISALAVWLTVRFGFKDKTGGRIMLFICAVFAFAITFADLSLFFANGGYHMEHQYDLLFKLSGWGMWEYFTGFFAGGLLMLIFVSLPFGRLAVSADTEEPFTAEMPGWLYGFLNFGFTFGMCFSATFIRPFAARYEASKAYLPLFIGLSAVFLIVAAVIIVRKGAALRGIDFRRFCTFALPAFFTAHVLIYLFAGTENMQNFRRSTDVANILVLISYIVFVLTYLILFKNGKIRTSKKNIHE